MRSLAEVTTDFRRWLPLWWRGEAGQATLLLDLVLAPVELLFRLGVAGRNAAFDRGVRRAERAPVPVVSVGNITVGGSGKTPVAAWLAARLTVSGRAPAIIMRGYGADELSVHRELNPGIPVHAAPLRMDAIRVAVAEGADCVILDDGFQHRPLTRDLDIVLVACEQWSRRRRMLPRGPWREPVASLARAHYVLVTRKSATRADAIRVREELLREGVRCAVGIATLESSSLIDFSSPDSRRDSLDAITGQRVLAVTTLADPRPFLAQLAGAGAEVDAMPFPDHHEFTDDDIQRIATRLGDRPLVVTRKEAVKLRGRMPIGTGTHYFLDQRVEIDLGGDRLEECLRSALGVAR